MERKKEKDKKGEVNGTDGREENQRDSTASRFTSRIRSRRNSVVEFFQRKLTSEKNSTRSPVSVQKCEETQEKNENHTNVRKSTEAESTDRFQGGGESPTNWENPPVDSKANFYEEGKIPAPITEVNP